MGAAPVPKFVQPLGLDFPDIFRQFFVGKFSRQEETQHCIFSQGYLHVKMASKTVMIRFSALLPISALFRISAPFVL